MRRRRSRHVALVCLAFAVCIGPVSAEADTAAPAARHLIGVGGGYTFAPFGFDDPYSGAYGGGVFYEIHHASGLGQLYFGARLSSSGFSPINPSFEASTMVQTGSYAGISIPLYAARRVEWTAAPYWGYHHYVRWHTFEGKRFVTSRPVGVGGIDLRVAHEKVAVGIRSEYQLLFERLPLRTVTVRGYLAFPF